MHVSLLHLGALQSHKCISVQCDNSHPKASPSHEYLNRSVSPPDTICLTIKTAEKLNHVISIATAVFAICDSNFFSSLLSARLISAFDSVGETVFAQSKLVQFTHCHEFAAPVLCDKDECSLDWAWVSWDSCCECTYYSEAECGAEEIHF